MHIDDIFYDGKSQSGSPGVGRAGLLDPVELVKDQRKLLRRDHIAVVGDRNLNGVRRSHYLNRDPLTLRAIFDGVAYEVIEQAGQQVAVCRNDLGRHIALQLIGKSFIRKVRIGFLQKLS